MFLKLVMVLGGPVRGGLIYLTLSNKAHGDERGGGQTTEESIILSPPPPMFTDKGKGRKRQRVIQTQCVSINNTQENNFDTYLELNEMRMRSGFSDY